MLIPSLSSAPRPRIIAAADYARIAAEQNLLASAQTKADTLLAAAEQEAQRLRADGYAQGIAEARAAQAATLMALEAHFETGWQRIEQGVAKLLTDCMARLLADLPDTVQLPARLQKTLQELRPQGQATLRAHPQAMAGLATWLAEVSPEGMAGLRLRLAADERLGPHDLVLETTLGMVDLRLDTQLDLVRQAVTAALATRPSESLHAR